MASSPVHAPKREEITKPHPQAKTVHQVLAQAPEPDATAKKLDETPPESSRGGAPNVSAHVSDGNGTGGGAIAASYRGELWAAIENVKEYPARARERGQMGKVKVGFTLKKDGLITNVHLSEACEYEILNQAALDTLKRLGTIQSDSRRGLPGRP